MRRDLLALSALLAASTSRRASMTRQNMIYAREALNKNRGLGLTSLVVLLVLAGCSRTIEEPASSAEGTRQEKNFSLATDHDDPDANNSAFERRLQCQ
jgi:hypothetical protein